jgi:hypothetical protein
MASTDAIPVIDVMLDIETRRPTEDDPTWIARTRGLDESERAALWARAPLDPTLGLVACVAVDVGDGKPVVHGGEDRVWDPLTDELWTLYELQTWLTSCYTWPVTLRIVTHNGAAFDRPFLRARAIVQLARARREGRTEDADSMLLLVSILDSIPMIDTCDAWGRIDGKRASLSALCAALGVTRADTIPSAEVPYAWAMGRRSAVVEHVVANVLELRACWHILREVTR